MKPILYIIIAGFFILTLKMTWDIRQQNNTIEDFQKNTTETYEKKWNDIKRKQDENEYNNTNSSIGKHTIIVGMLTTNSI